MCTKRNVNWTISMKFISGTLLMFDNNDNFKDKHFKLAGNSNRLHSHLSVGFSDTVTSCFLLAYKSTHETKSHKHNIEPLHEISNNVAF